MPRRCLLAGLLLGRLLASDAAAQARSGAASAFDLASAAAERSLQQGDLPAAEGRYREALFEGLLLVATLERLEGRPEEARETLGRASSFAGEDRQALQSLATAYLRSGEASKALPILTGLSDRDAGDVETRRLLARALAGSGQIEKAVQTLDQAISPLPGDPEQVFVLATEYLWLKKADVAERLFAQVVRARPIPQTHVLIGRAYRDGGEYERARVELRAALGQDPTVRRAHYYLGMVILSDTAAGWGRLEMAIAEFQEELKQAPRDPSSNDQLGLALLQAGRPAEALSPLETAVREDTRSLFVYHLGRCQLALDRPADAAASSRRALDLARAQGASEAELQQIHYQLGLALRKLGSAEEATAQLSEARHLAASGGETSREGAAPGLSGAAFDSPSEASPLSELPPSERRELKGRVREGLARAYFNLGVLQARSQHHDRAAELFEGAAAFEPSFPQLQASLGVAYFNAGRFDRASGPLTRAVEARPEDPGLKRMLALSWLNLEAWDKAAPLLEGDPDRRGNASLQFAYGLALLRSQRGAEAEGVLAALLAGPGGGSADLNLLLGQAQAQQGNFESAVRSLERAREIKADLPGVDASLGGIYKSQGHLKEAEAALRAEVERHPSDTKSGYELASVLDLDGRSEEAHALLDPILKKKPDFGDAHYLLGKILLSEGHAAEAREQLETAARLAPEEPDVRYELGLAYEKLGHADDARQQFELFRQLKDKRRGKAP